MGAELSTTVDEIDTEKIKRMETAPSTPNVKDVKNLPQPFIRYTKFSKSFVERAEPRANAKTFKYP